MDDIFIPSNFTVSETVAKEATNEINNGDTHK